MFSYICCAYIAVSRTFWVQHEDILSCYYSTTEINFSFCFSTQTFKQICSGCTFLTAGDFFFNPQGLFWRSLPFSHMIQSTFWTHTVYQQITALLLFLPFLYLRYLMMLWWKKWWRFVLEKGNSSVNMIPWPLRASQWEMPHSGPTKII